LALYKLLFTYLLTDTTLSQIAIFHLLTDLMAIACKRPLAWPLQWPQRWLALHLKILASNISQVCIPSKHNHMTEGLLAVKQWPSTVWK